jgi:DNA repair protein RadA/Sms
MASKVTYLCEACGYIAPSYLGRCPECQAWNTFSEQVSIKATKPGMQQRGRGFSSGSFTGGSGFKASSLSTAPTGSAASLGSFSPINEPPPGLRRLCDVQMEEAPVRSSGFAELDRVLGGGILPGSYVLVGGDPGIGKSTLMLQVASAFGQSAAQTNLETGEITYPHPVLYVAGEESAYQVRLRAERLGGDTRAINVFPATDLHTVVEVIRQTRPPLAIIDSIQSMYSADAAGTPGSVSQIRECAAILMDVAKSLNVPIFLIGHVTKDGAVAGPKLLEHTVDAVLYFEGEKYQNLRILRAVKNRFGNTQEIGVFEMVESGLREIDNPSALFLANGALFGSSGGQPGSVIAAILEGSRPLLVEIQALVGQSTYPSPRRVGNGIDYNRMHQIVAVLERRLGLDFSRQDIYVNVVGGLRVDEPAADLAVAIAIVSSARDLPVLPGTAVTGEIGLTGEIRPVSQTDRRQREAVRIGLSRMLIPAGQEQSRVKSAAAENRKSDKPPEARMSSENIVDKLSTSDEEAFSLESCPVATLADAVRTCFAPKDWSRQPPLFESLPPASGYHYQERDTQYSLGS